MAILTRPEIRLTNTASFIDLIIGTQPVPQQGGKQGDGVSTASWKRPPSPCFVLKKKGASCVADPRLPVCDGYQATAPTDYYVSVSPMTSSAIDLAGSCQPSSYP